MASMAPWQIGLYAASIFGMSILSGIAGGGGGFVNTPLLIILGLPPSMAVSTDKVGGFALTVGSILGLRSQRGLAKWRRVVPVMALAFGVGLLVPFAIRRLAGPVYSVLMGVIILAMIPVMILKRVGLERRSVSHRQQTAGGMLLTVTLALQGIFGGGLSSLVNLVLMGMFGMTANEANLTKRCSQLVLTATVLVGVMRSGLVVWPLALAGVPASCAGGYIGGRTAIRKGDQYVLKVMMSLMLVSGLALIYGAVF